ncbi:Hypothetical protein D9617_2g059880 [Elsinoe fawcettii]|nr:Hypothetical protein D9617_2g059880 [Elsinoe fawcettii]
MTAPTQGIPTSTAPPVYSNDRDTIVSVEPQRSQEIALGIANPAPRQTRLKSHSSFINPFRSRNSRTTTAQIAPVHHDPSVPPLNFAYHEDLPLASPFTSTPLSIEHITSKNRRTSVSIKRKIKRIFSRGKNEEAAVPAQQVPAKQFHFNVNTPEDNAADTIPDSRRPSLMAVRLSQDAHRPFATGSVNDEAIHSRVTSWTSSTVAGTQNSSVTGSKRLSSIRELPSQAQHFRHPDDVPDADERPSLHLRRKRQTNSEDSQRLYDALRMQITSNEKSDHDALDPVADASPVTDSAKCTSDLAAQQSPLRRRIAVTKSNKRTVRAVSPEIMLVSKSAVAHGADHFGENDVPLKRRSHHSGHREPDTLMRKSTREEESVSDVHSNDTDVHAKRMHKANNRWREALGEESPRLARALQCVDEDDPYRLGSIPTSPQMEGLPIAIRHSATAETGPGYETACEQRGLTSPSIYSHQDLAVLPLDSPDGPGGTRVTVIEREVKKYRLDDQPRTGHVATASRTSNEWRAWANDQMTELEDNSMTKAFTLRDLDCEVSGAGNGVQQDLGPFLQNGLSQTIVSSPSCAPSVGTRGVDPPLPTGLHLGKVRQKMTRRKSSKALNSSDNATETSRHSSERGLKALSTKVSQVGMGAIRRISSSTRIGSSNVRNNKSPPLTGPISDEVFVPRTYPPPPPVGPRTISPSPSGLSLSPVTTRPAPIPPSRPMVASTQPEHQHIRNPSASTAQTTIIHSTPTRTQSSFTTTKAKSSIDLRARFRPSKESMRETSINIRRRIVPTSEGKDKNKVEVFEDMTLQRISEGPYAFSPERAYGETSVLALPASQQDVTFDSSMMEAGKENRHDMMGKSWMGRTVRPAMSLRSLRERKEAAAGLRERGSGVLREQSESPGQRMAEEFLRGKGRGSPRSPVVGSSPMFL